MRGGVEDNKFCVPAEVKPPSNVPGLWSLPSECSFPASNKEDTASLWFYTPPGHHPHLLCRCVFWLVFGTVHEKGESCSRSLPTTGSLFPSITMFHQEDIIAKGKWIGLCLDSAEGNSRRQLSGFSAAPALAPYHSIL